MSLGLFALVAFLLVGSIAAFLGRDAGVDPNPMPFSASDSAVDAVSDTMPVAPVGALPSAIPESSGLAHSHRNPDVWYTHNDGSEGRVFAIRMDGTLVGSWKLEGVDLHDIEDIAYSPCPANDGTACLYLADTGDNGRDRDDYAVYIVREPDVRGGGGSSLELVAAQRYTYGGDSRDAEALTVLPDGSILVITKGQEEGAEVFRLPSLRRTLPGAPREIRAAESLGMLPVDVDRRRNRITAAAVSPSGRILAVRSDVAVRLFQLPDREPIRTCGVDGYGDQGEGMDFINESTLLLTFEAEAGRAPIVRVRCPA